MRATPSTPSSREPSVKLLPYGPRAVLVEFESLGEVMAAATTWRHAALPGVIDVVPAARTVLVTHDGSLATDVLREPTEAAPPRGDTVSIDVVYDGADLDDVAAATGMSVDDVVRLHSGAEYTVAFCGFMPGFAYLVGLPTELQLPRRPTPRTRVPSGAVAIAAEFAGIYPRESPGGWHLLGHTGAVLWDETREPSALLTPGTVVRFNDVGGLR